MASPHAKPTALKILEGNPGKRPLPKNEPKPKPTAPKCPSNISRKAKAEWKRIAPKLERIGILTEIDGSALAAYCQAYSRWVEAEEKLKDEDLTVTTANGNVLQNPLVNIANKQMLLMHRYLTEFGMTPSSRTRIQVKKDDGESEMASYLT